MDTSPEYIKMCETAEEIQALRPSRPFHMVLSSREIWRDGDDVWMFRDFDTNNPKRIWLPTQEQLQGMVRVRGFSWMLITFWQFCKAEIKEHKWITGEVNSLLNSWNKLWLAFAMQELHKRRWTGEGWEEMK